MKLTAIAGSVGKVDANESPKSRFRKVTMTYALGTRNEATKKAK